MKYISLRFLILLIGACATVFLLNGVFNREVGADPLSSEGTKTLPQSTGPDPGRVSTGGLAPKLEGSEGPFELEEVWTERYDQVRMKPRKGWTIVFVGQDQTNVLRGVVRALLVTEDLKSDIESNLGFNGDDLRSSSELVELAIQGRQVDFSDLSPGVEYFVWPEIDGFLTEGRFHSFPTEEEEWLLHPASGLSIRVVNTSGDPVGGVEVRVFYSTADTGYLGYSWRERLRRKFFYWSDRTESSGIARLSYPLSVPMSVTCEHIQGFNVSMDYEAFDGEEVVLRMAPGFTVFGTVSEASGEPVPTGFVGFLYMGDERTEDAGSAVVEQDGTFICPDVSADHSALLAIAYSDGYTVDEKHILSPQPGDLIRLDFQLQKAQGVHLRLLQPSGAVLDKIEVMASEDGFDWVPGSYFSDSAGCISTAPSFLPGHRYLLTWWSDGWSGPPVPFSVPENPDVVIDLVLPAMGYVGAVVCSNPDLLGDEGLEYEFHSLVHSDSGVVSWSDPAARSPWIPIGPGILAVNSMKLGRVDTLVDILPGDNGVVAVPVQTGYLRFVLPDKEDNSRWEVRIVNTFGYRDSPVMLPAGGAELQLPVGRHSLVIETGSLRGYSIGPFNLTERGLDLGEIQLSGGAVYGTVVDEDGSPWPGISLELHRDDNWFGGLTRTSVDGSFFFADLAPGEYQLSVLPNTSLLLFQPDQTINLRLGQNELREGLVFSVPGSAVGKCTLPMSAMHPVQGFHARSDWLEVSHVDGEMSFPISAPFPGDWVGGFSTGYGGASFYGTPVVSSAVDFAIDDSSAREREIRIVDNAGRPIAAAHIEFRLFESIVFPGGASSDSEGLFHCFAPIAFPLELLVHLPNGGLSVVPISSLPESGDFMIGGELVSANFHCQTLVGDPVPGVTIWNTRTRTRAITAADGNGTLSGNPSADQIRIEKAGFVSTIVRLQNSTVVLLRRSLPLVAFSTPEGVSVSRIAIDPLFSLGYPIEIEPIADDSRHRWVVAGIPEGAYLIRALDSEGVVLLSREINLAAGDSGEITLH